jgi:putative transposase
VKVSFFHPTQFGTLCFLGSSALIGKIIPLKENTMKQIHPDALFRLSVLGPLASRDHLEKGDLKTTLRELSTKSYAIPNSTRFFLSEKTIAGWYYAWKRGGIDALTPKQRSDSGISKMSEAIQEAICAAKKENPARSLRSIRQLVTASGLPGATKISRSSIHRLLQSRGISNLPRSAAEPVERRTFVAARAGDIWYGDVMHGPKVMIKGHLCKAYLVSFMDDASRLITHSAFCPAETALEVEGVLKQALLKRGLPIKLVIDNGAAYRAATLQSICARLEIRLIYCRPYTPEGKGKLERWHRTLRGGFLAELDMDKVRDIHDLNARLWAWMEECYHKEPHSALDGLTPLERYRKDLVQIRPLGLFASSIDEMFLHRHERLVRKDGTVSYLGERFEVPYELIGKKVHIVVDPHREKVIGVESKSGESLGKATHLDPLANCHRKRRSVVQTDTKVQKRTGANLVEMALTRQTKSLCDADIPTKEEV